MKVMKTYTLPDDLVQAYDLLPMTRTASIRFAIVEAHRDVTALGRVLVRRLVSSKVSQSDSKRVTVRLDDPDVKKLNEMAERSCLPIEHVLRLVMEAYILKAHI